MVGNYCLLSLHSPPWAAQVSLSRLPAGMCIGQTRPTELSGNPEASLSHLYDTLLAPYLCQPLLSLGGKLDSSLHLWASLLMSLGTMGTAKLVLYTVYFSRHLPGPCFKCPSCCLLKNLLSFPVRWPLSGVVQRAMVLGKFLLSNLFLF